VRAGDEAGFAAYLDDLRQRQRRKTSFIAKLDAAFTIGQAVQGAGSALGGDEPYQAFIAVAGSELWHWPTAKRTEAGAKMHAKLAVADRRVLFVTSAQSGVGKNIEAGLLIRGGPAPARAAEHVDALRASGDLIRLN
jgi:phosphatidylserine/phosphatidylglycerophosphate/cardiolipin synthase-like enzyme